MRRGHHFFPNLSVNIHGRIRFQGNGVGWANRKRSGAGGSKPGGRLERSLRGKTAHYKNVPLDLMLVK